MERNETYVKNESYVVIQGWMVNLLKLKGNELMIFATIYGFSQDAASNFTGSIQYLADWTNSTRPGVIKVLKKLTEQELIVKTEMGKNRPNLYKVNMKKIEEIKLVNKVYQSTEFTSSGKQSLLEGSTEFTSTGKLSLPNNIIYNLDNNINNKIDDSTSHEEQEKNQSIIFKNNFKKLKEIIIQSTGVAPQYVDGILNPGAFKDKVDLELLIQKIQESDFLSGKLKRKPNIMNFSTMTMINRILADGYKNFDKQPVEVKLEDVGNKVNIKISDEQIKLYEKLGI